MNAITPHPYRRPQDLEAILALVKAVRPPARLCDFYNAPGYQPELALVALAPDGTPAAYCLYQIDPEQNAITGQKAGSTDPVGTHPYYQGLGLATALLLHGMSLLRARGIEVARLATSSANPSMQRAAQKAGFVVEAQNVWFEKKLR